MLSFSGNLDYALERIRSASMVRNGDGLPARIAPATGRSGGMVKTAQSQVIYSQPQFFSPMHTNMNWQIPQKRRDVYLWCRHFAENEPKVAAALTFYSEFPVTGFETECEYENIKSYYDHVNEKIQLDAVIKKISREYYLIGDAFPMINVACETCRGTNVTRNNKRCEHKGGTINGLVVLNPDWIEVESNQFSTDDPVITLIPDDGLRRVVFNRKPVNVYERIPAHLRPAILAGKPIPLDNFNISHLKHQPYAYGTYGTSLIRRLFPYLAYKIKLMSAQWTIADRLILPVRIVKVGSEERPAGQADIADVQQQLAQTANDPNLTLVTHHNINYEWYGASGKFATLSNEFDFINKEVLQGLMISEALLSGEQAGYTSAAIGAETMVQRMEAWRLELGRWIELKIYKPIAKMRGFIDEAKSKKLGEEVYIYPHIKWNDLNIRDDSQQKQFYRLLFDSHVISGRTLCEKCDIDYDQEVTRRRWENAEQKIGGAAPGAGAGGAGGMGDLFGGGGGGAPPDMGGGMPPPGGPPGGDMGGMPPPGGAPGGDMGGMPPPGGPPATAASMGGTQGKILSRGRQAKAQSPVSEEEAQPTGIPLTTLEQIMYEMLWNMRYSMKLPFDPYAQFPLGPYKADFAIPQIKLSIECDGDIWHKDPTKKAKDQIRDATLAKFGWTTVRFSEGELKENKDGVWKTVSALIYKLWKRAAEQQQKRHKKTASTDETLRIIEAQSQAENIDIEDDVAFVDMISSDMVVSFVCPPLGIVPMAKSNRI